jgi:4-hydroxybenzoate polyprenyltransferase
MISKNNMVADALKGSWVHRLLPQWLWPYAQLARWERPIGWWLLMWPCWWSAALAAAAQNRFGYPDPWHLALFMAGAIVMRGAGCTYNDLVDQDIDDKVARTRSRPLPSGRISRRGALIFLVIQLITGLLVLLQFNQFTILLGGLSLIAVAIYPFMKRITWWPQLFLGIAFSWGALMGWAAAESALGWPVILLYAGSICWVIGYDTIYAHQDIEDDILAGVKSTARLFGRKTRLALAILYSSAFVLFSLSFWAAQAGWPALLGLALGGAHMIWQIGMLDLQNPSRCLVLFKSNSHFGWIIFAGLILAGIL